MKRIKNKKSRLCIKLFEICVFAFGISSSFFVLLSYFSKPIVENYLNVSEITEKQQQRIAGRFQNFVKENHIKIKELDKIENWIKKEPYVYLKLYYNDTLIFDSISNLKKDSLKEQKNNDKISDLNTLNPYYEIEFDNATALALFYCLTREQMISQVKKILLILSFIVYFLILIVFIKKKLKYIFKIQKEVERLSKVSLEYPITIYGNDEIEDIAKGIEDMRLFAIEKIEKEKQIYKSNQELLTSLTHDIRTPLTSLIGYLEILNNIKNSEKERVTYQHAALEKAYYIKKLTDSLFDYYYIQYHEKNIKMEIVNGNELIMQMVEENLFDFEIIGIKVCREIEDINCNLKLNVDLIYRVFENIFSNIKKYADLTKNLFIGYKKQDKYLLVYFKNFKKNTINSKGTHIGIKSCSNILRIHNGKLEIKEDKVSYLISIFLPILN